jgi:hypothetical protein
MSIIVAGKAITTCREQERRTGGKDKIRNTQRGEIVGTNIREQMIYIYICIYRRQKYMFSSRVGEKVPISYMLYIKTEGKKRVFIPH